MTATGPMRPILLERRRGRAPNALRAPALQQHDDVQAIATPFGTERRTEGGDCPGCDLASDERAHHGIMVKRVPAVLAALDDRGQPVLGDDHQGRQLLFHVRRRRGDRDIRGQRIAIQARTHGHPRVRLLGGLRDLTPHGGLVAAHELLAAVDDRLRRVEAVRAEDAAVVLLPFGRDRQRGGILPPELVPVGHVHPARNDQHALRRLLGGQLAQHDVRRRAARTALGRVQLDDDGHAIGLGRLPGRQAARRDHRHDHRNNHRSHFASLLSALFSAAAAAGALPGPRGPAYFLFASTSIVTLISSPTTGPASISALYCSPKSRRFNVVVAEAPTFWPCCVLMGADGGSTVRVTSFVTPCSVRSPTSLNAPWPAPSTRFDLNVAVGNFATSKKLGDLRSLSRFSLRVLIPVTSMVMSALMLPTDLPS